MDKIKLIDALNRIDEFASFSVEDNDNGEAEILEKDYLLLYNFIKDYDEKNEQNEKDKENIESSKNKPVKRTA